MADQRESAGARRLLRNREPKKFIAEMVDADRFARFVLGLVFRQIVKYLGVGMSI